MGSCMSRVNVKCALASGSCVVSKMPTLPFPARSFRYTHKCCVAVLQCAKVNLYLCHRDPTAPESDLKDIFCCLFSLAYSDARKCIGRHARAHLTFTLDTQMYWNKRARHPPLLHAFTHTLLMCLIFLLSHHPFLTHQRTHTHTYSLSLVLIEFFAPFPPLSSSPALFLYLSCSLSFSLSFCLSPSPPCFSLALTLSRFLSTPSLTVSLSHTLSLPPSLSPALSLSICLFPTIAKL